MTITFTAYGYRYKDGVKTDESFVVHDCYFDGETVLMDAPKAKAVKEMKRPYVLETLIVNEDTHLTMRYTQEFGELDA